MQSGMCIVTAGALGAALALGVAPASAVAGPPALVAQARYVALGFDQGSGFVSETDNRPDVLPDERLALQRIRASIESWGRYVITDRPGQADLLIAIRKGRLASIGVGFGGGASRGTAETSPLSAGQSLRTEVSSPEDMIEVFDKGGGLVWRGMKANGLAGAGPPLWDSFRAEVLKADGRTRKP